MIIVNAHKTYNIRTEHDIRGYLVQKSYGIDQGIYSRSWTTPMFE